MTDRVAKDIEHWFDERQLEKERMMGDRFDDPRFFQKLEQKQRARQAQGRGDKDEWQVGWKMYGKTRDHERRGASELSHPPAMVPKNAPVALTPLLSATAPARA